MYWLISVHLALPLRIMSYQQFNVFGLHVKFGSPQKVPRCLVFFNFGTSLSQTLKKLSWLHEGYKHTIRGRSQKYTKSNKENKGK